MDISKILEDLKNASSFELYRLNVAIEQQLESPDNIKQIKSCLKLNQEISYFDSTENRLIKAKVIRLNRTQLLVENLHNQEHWNIPYYYVNVDDIDPSIKNLNNEKGIPKSQLSVGDRVGFLDKQNTELYGKVIRLNPKTATIVIDDGHEWRVAYCFLFPVIEVENGTGTMRIEVLP